MKLIAIDVREFALPIPRRGSIEPGSGYGFNGITALGQEIHTRVQQQRKGVYEYYRPEVKISHKFELDGYCIAVSGRIDGLFEPPDQRLERSDDASAATSEADIDGTECDTSKTANFRGFPGELGSTLTAQSNVVDQCEREKQGQNVSALGHVLIASPNFDSAASTFFAGAQKKAPPTSGEGTSRERIAQLNIFEPADESLRDVLRCDDGRSANKPHIEEIKSAFSAAKLARRLQIDPFHPYWLQVKTYAYLYWKQKGTMPSAALYLVSMFGSESIDLPVEFEIEPYEKWLASRLQDLVNEAKRQESEYERRKTISHTLVLPFERARPGQQELIENIESGINSDKPILIQAPTGLGKTIAVMLPALRDSLRRGQRLIYTTPKNSIHTVAEEAVERLRQKKSEVKSLTLTAKAKLCMLPEPICDPNVCEYARDYYTKVAEHDLVNKAAENNCMTPALFTDIAEEYKVCPFELSIDCIDRADLVICDYNHVLAPLSLSGRLTAPTHKADAKPNLIIDEAHNLHTRATGYFSSTISTQELLEFQSRFNTYPLSMKYPAAYKLAKAALDLVHRTTAGQQAPEAQVVFNKSEFASLADKVTALMFDCLEGDPNLSFAQPVVEFYRLWDGFCKALNETEYEQFYTYKRKGNETTLKITCCDASTYLKQQYGQFENVLAFSATLKPFDYYSTLTGFDKQSSLLFEAASPFPRENRKVLVIPQISTKFSDRSSNFAKICDTIQRITALRQANYILFFPSFDFLEQIAQRLNTPSYKLLIQKRSMTRTEVNGFLEDLKGNESQLLLAVQGGVFSEGIDFVGKMASGAIIVGPGLPSYNLERELLREYYERTYGSGFEYAYAYPAMTKVIQSAGRVVRSETDRGLIVLLDKRFLHNSYAEAMPAGWYDGSASELVSNSILREIENFWQGSPSASS